MTFEKKNFFLKKIFMLYHHYFFKCLKCAHFSGMTPKKITCYQMCRCVEYMQTIFVAQMSLLFSYQPIKVYKNEMRHPVFAQIKRERTTFKKMNRQIFLLFHTKTQSFYGYTSNSIRKILIQMYFDTILVSNIQYCNLLYNLFQQYNN